jgi:putative oxidoreductase
MDSILYGLFTTDNAYYATIARIISGIVILPYGLLKLGFAGGIGIAGTLEDFKNRRLPKVIAWLVIISQSLGSIALIVGFCTRLAASGAIIIFTAAIFAHIKDGWMMNWHNKKNGEGVEYFVLLLALLWISLIYGGGGLSIDGWLLNRISS